MRRSGRPNTTASRVRRVAAALAALGSVALLAACTPPPAAPAAGSDGPSYVAIGDSWTAGPLVPDPVGNPIDCGQSSRNWPRLVAAQIGARRFRDVSCGGADTEDLTARQRGQLRIFGAAPPQLDALDDSTTLVTFQMGGNDVGMASRAIDCINLFPFELGPAPFGRPCSDDFVTEDFDRIANDIAETRPKIDDALAAIHQRSPHAQVLVVGYPNALPDTGDGCWPRLPILAPDVHYLRERFKDMNQMLRDAAVDAGAQYVDTYDPTIGHDACQPSGEAWINSLTLEPMALPFHPNEFSHRAVADIVAEAVNARS